MATYGNGVTDASLAPVVLNRTPSPSMVSRYITPGSPSSASGLCPGSPSSTRSLDDLLICPVCLDEFKDPKTLSCLHSFCCKCLESCKRPYRRDITCPVCKKVTPLSSFGVGALQNDFRIQQIRDILLNRPNSPGTSVEEQTAPVGDPDSKVCDICKSVSKRNSASSHCIQCFMFFCGGCIEKHNANPLFTAHHVIIMSESHTSNTLFCKNHKEHPVRYFCKPCSQMLCTICTLEHNPNHAPEPLEKGIIDKYRQQLIESLRMVHSKLSEVNSHSKYLEIVKQSHQKSLHNAQSAIRERTEEVIAIVRDKEQALLQELRQLVDNNMKQTGVDNLGEINFIKGTMDTLYADIQKVIKGSPQDCLLGYEELVGRMNSVKDTTLPAVGKKKKKFKVKFVPTPSADVDQLLGSLQECTVSDIDSSDDELVAASPPAGSTLSSYSTIMATSPKPTQNVSRRVSSILNAISPTRKTDAKKIGKVKAFSNTGSAERTPTSPSSPTTINADDLVASTMEASGGQAPSSPTQILSPVPSSPDPSQTAQMTGRLVFKVDQVGGWPGRIASPSSVIFLPDGSLAISECENRLQIFDRTGHSIRIIGWGKIKPQNVVMNSIGHLVITDMKDHCIKVFDASGDMVSMWGAGLFKRPSGIAISSTGKIIITDVETNNVSIHNSDGTVVTQFGSWGSGDYQFNHPTHVTVDRQDNIIVSDSGNSAIKVFDKSGVFLHKFSLQTSKQGLLRRPHGVTTDLSGNILIADHDNHRVSLFSPEGGFVRHLLNKQDGIRYPTGLSLDRENQYLAIVESHVGVLCKDPHHTVKLFKLH